MNVESADSADVSEPLISAGTGPPPSFPVTSEPIVTPSVSEMVRHSSAVMLGSSAGPFSGQPSVQFSKQTSAYAVFGVPARNSTGAELVALQWKGPLSFGGLHVQADMSTM